MAKAKPGRKSTKVKAKKSPSKKTPPAKSSTSKKQPSDPSPTKATSPKPKTSSKKPTPSVAMSEEATHLLGELAEELEKAKGSTARTIVMARIAVATVASEKTTTTRIASDEFDSQKSPHERADIEAARRCRPNLYDFFRANLDPKNHSEDPTQAWRTAQQRRPHELFPASSLEKLEKAEEWLKIILPPSYWDFCLEWGGGVLFSSPWRELTFLCTTDIQTELEHVLNGAMKKPYYPIVRLGAGDYLALDASRASKTGELPVVWWSLESNDKEQEVAETFLVFLQTFVEKHGDLYWLED